MRFKLVEKLQDETLPNTNEPVKEPEKEQPKDKSKNSDNKVEQPKKAEVNKKSLNQEIIDIKKNTKAMFIEED